MNICSVQSLSRARLFATPWIVARQASLSMGFPMECVAMPSSRGIFLIQGSNTRLLHCRHILYQCAPGKPSIQQNDSADSVLYISVQFSSVAHLCPTLCDPMNRSMPGLPQESHQEALYFLFTFCHKGGVICICEVIDISPGNLDFSLCFFQRSAKELMLLNCGVGEDS